jgi:prolyl-tRNA synthetase
VLPPRIAPYQIVVVPIYKNEEERAAVTREVGKISDECRDFRVVVDDRDNLTVGEKFYEWEKKGVPLRIEIGPRDAASGSVVTVLRDTGEKHTLSLSDLGSSIGERLHEMQERLYEASKRRTEEATSEVETFEEFKEVIEKKGGFVSAYWDGTEETEAKIKEETGATLRCIPFESGTSDGTCVYSGKPARVKALFAKAY